METTVKERLIEYLKYRNIGQNKFEKMAGISNGYISNTKGSIGTSVLTRIIDACPDLNKNWLLSGEGEMLKATQSVGDITNSNVSGVNVNGKEIHINPDAYQTLLKIVESNQKTTEKFQEQIDRLISVIEKKYDSENR